MGKFVAQRGVDVHPEHPGQHRQDHHGGAASDQRVHRAWTSARHGPTASKRGAPQVRGFVMWRLGLNFDSVAFNAVDVEPSDEPDAQCSDTHCTADDAVHVEAVEGKHFLDAEPRKHLGFDENEAKKGAENEGDDVFHASGIKRGGREERAN